MTDPNEILKLVAIPYTTSSRCSNGNYNTYFDGSEVDKKIKYNTSTTLTLINYYYSLENTVEAFKITGSDKSGYVSSKIIKENMTSSKRTYSIEDASDLDEAYYISLYYSSEAEASNREAYVGKNVASLEVRDIGYAKSVKGPLDYVYYNSAIEDSDSLLNNAAKLLPDYGKITTDIGDVVDVPVEGEWRYDSEEKVFTNKLDMNKLPDNVKNPNSIDSSVKISVGKSSITYPLTVNKDKVLKGGSIIVTPYNYYDNSVIGIYSAKDDTFINKYDSNSKEYQVVSSKKTYQISPVDTSINIWALYYDNGSRYGYLSSASKGVEALDKDVVTSAYGEYKTLCVASSATDEELKKIAVTLPKTVYLTGMEGDVYQINSTAEWEIDKSNNYFSLAINKSDIPDDIECDDSIIENGIKIDFSYIYPSYFSFSISPSKCEKGSSVSFKLRSILSYTTTSRVYQLTKNASSALDSKLVFESDYSPEGGSTSSNIDVVYNISSASDTNSGEYVAVFYNPSSAIKNRVGYVAASMPELTVGHTNIINTSYVAPTCTEKGMTAGSYCSVCGVTISGRVAVRETGHDYEAKYDWDTTGTTPTCSLKMTCKNNPEHTFTATAMEVTLTSYEEGNCIKDGYKNYEAEVVYKGTRYFDTKRIELEASENNHKFTEEKADDKYLYSKADCKNSARYYYSCSVCGAAGINTFEYGTSKGHNFEAKNINEAYLMKAASCTSKAMYYYSCTGCGKKGTETFEYGSVSNHSFTEKNTSGEYLCKKASCISPAVYYYSCSKCGAKGSSTFTYGSDSSHVVIKISRKAATVNSSGNEEYYQCTKCGKYYSDVTCRMETTPADMVIPQIEEGTYIKGICQMPYYGNGGGYLIGVESYDNPNNEYSYELLILDCTKLAMGENGWVYSTGKRKTSTNCCWTVWQPLYGYYWTLFRVYDKDGNLIDQLCYGFANI